MAGVDFGIGRGARTGAGFFVDFASLSLPKKMLPAASASSLCGKGASFFNYEKQVKLPRQVANEGPVKRAALLILQMATAARQVCMAAGSDVLMDADGAEKISAITFDNCVPEAMDSVYQEIARFLQFKR